MKVVFVIASLDMGGAERHVVTVAPALDRSRFDVSVVCLEQRGSLFPLVEQQGIAAHCLSGGRSPLGVARAAWSLGRLFKRERPDVVITSGFRAGIVGRIVARSCGVGVLIDWKHNIGHLGLVGVKERMTEAVLGPITTRYLGVCFTQVPYLVDYLRLDPSRIGVVHNSVKLAGGPQRTGTISRESIGLRPEDLVVGVIAVLRPEKDHATLLRALGHLRSDGVGATLVVVGDGPELPRLVALASELGLADHVRFLGRRSDVDHLLPLFDVVALSSVTIECFPYAVLEAMAASRPVVATCVGGLPEMVEDGRTGFLVPPCAPRAMAEALSAVLTRPDRARLLGCAGRKRLEDRWPFPAAVSKVEHELMAAVAVASGPTPPIEISTPASRTA